MTNPLTLIGAAFVASLFTLRVGRLILCRLLFKLARVAVFGKSASESARILKTAKLPQMTVANFDEVRQAATRVQDSMRHQGYLDAVKKATEQSVRDGFLLRDDGDKLIAQAAAGDVLQP